MTEAFSRDGEFLVEENKGLSYIALLTVYLHAVQVQYIFFCSNSRDRKINRETRNFFFYLEWEFLVEENKGVILFMLTIIIIHNLY